MLRGKKRSHSSRGKIGGGRGKFGGRSGKIWGVSGARIAKNETAAQRPGKNGARSETKTGRASAGEKIASPRSGANLGMPGVRTPRKKRQCSGLGENWARSARKTNNRCAAGEKRGAKRREPGEIYSIIPRKKMLCSHSRNRYLIPGSICLYN